MSTSVAIQTWSLIQTPHSKYCAFHSLLVKAISTFPLMTMPGGQGVDHLSNVKEIHLFHHFLQVCTVSLKLDKVSTKFMIDAGLVSGWREFPEDNTIMTDKSPPIREYDSVNYTCYNKKLELPHMKQHLTIKCFLPIIKSRFQGCEV